MEKQLDIYKDKSNLEVVYSFDKLEFVEETILDIAKIADKIMYQAKAAYYAKKGVDQRGQAAANTALCNLYTKILKVNTTDDTYSIVNMDVSEQISEKGFADTISAWLTSFGKSSVAGDDSSKTSHFPLLYIRVIFIKCNNLVFYSLVC